MCSNNNQVKERDEKLDQLVSTCVRSYPHTSLLLLMTRLIAATLALFSPLQRPMTVETAAARIYLPQKKNKTNVRWVVKSIPLSQVSREITYGPALFQPYKPFRCLRRRSSASSLLV